MRVRGGLSHRRATVQSVILQRVGKHISSSAPNASSNEPSNDTCIPEHSKFEASDLPFPNTNCSRLELAMAF